MVFPHSVEDEPVEQEEQWEHAEVVETEAAPPVRDMSIRSTVPYPSPPEDLAEWSAQLKRLKDARKTDKREKENQRILERGIEVKLSLSPKRYVAAAEALGMTVQTYAVLIWHPPVYQEKDGKVRKDGTQVMAGELKTPASEKVHLTVEAKHPKAALGFQGFWVNGQFTEAFIYDPIGLPTLLQHEYDPIKVAAGKNETSESINRRERQAERDAADWNATYNDGETWLAHERLVKSGAELDAWLDEWMDQLGSEAKRLSRAKRPIDNPEELTEADLLGGAEWTG